VYEIGMPWLLGHLLFAGPSWSVVPLVVAASFVVVHSTSLALSARGRPWLINVGLLVSLSCVAAAGQPILVGAFGISLLAPVTWQAWLHLRNGGGLESEKYRHWAQVWWWAAMLIAALAAGQ
jgi:hypothetical protein